MIQEPAKRLCIFSTVAGDERQVSIVSTRWVAVTTIIKMNRVIEQLNCGFHKRGMQGRIVPIRRLYDLQKEINELRHQGLIDQELYQEGLSFFTFQPPEDFQSAASLMVVAVPRPRTKISFTLCEKKITLTLPPTYMGAMEVNQQIQNQLTKWLAPIGYHVAPAKLPRKLLSVRSGLARYGRNNIAYIFGLGSFFQLTAFFSDLPCVEDTWDEPRILDQCRDCHICTNKCPTGAITHERFLLHAEKCLSFHNERSPDHQFPGWIDPKWHHCLVGCMLCQQFCPENQAFLKWFEGNQEFSHEETDLFLRGTPPDRLPDKTRAKLRQLGLLDFLPKLLPRNLSVFFKR